MRLQSSTWAAILLVAAGSIAACGGSDDPNPVEDDGQGAGGTGGSPTSSSSSSTTGGGGTVTQVWQAAFLEETEAGEAPAALSFDNASSGIISGVLLETTFWQVAPMTAESWRIGRSADVQTDGVIGFHDSFDPNSACAFLPVVISGVTELLPGQAYVYRVTDDGNTYAGEIVDDPNPAPAFFGLRAWLASALPPESTVEVTLQGVAEPVVIDLLFDDRSNYQAVELPAANVTSIALQSSAGERWEASLSHMLDSAFGYTIYLGFTPPADAPGLTELEATP